MHLISDADNSILSKLSQHRKNHRSLASDRYLTFLSATGKAWTRGLESARRLHEETAKPSDQLVLATEGKPGE
jgi:hypothetical protein